MKELNEYTAEVRQRVEVRCRTRRQQRLRVAAVCAALALCVGAGALLLPFGQKAPTEPAETAPRIFNASAQELSGRTPGQSGGESELQELLSSYEAENNQPSAPEQAEETAIPEDFSFRFVWGCYGISSYDSRTGELVKTTDATHPEDYVTTLTLTEEQRREVWLLLRELDLETYPAQYDPYNAPDAETQVESTPSRDLILTVRTNGGEYTVACRDICLGGEWMTGYDDRAQAFLEVCERLQALLTGTPEWEALPEYEKFYE